ncbi:MAG: 16S rRNA processing protein RimM [Candidatus Binataceae bacterium]|nr:16S rRNA processing protein RimM [Candidatus Binataceae bacterium]
MAPDDGLPPANSLGAAPVASLRIGVIAGAHGLKGALRVRPDNPDSTMLTPGMTIAVERAGRREEHRIVHVTPIGHGRLRLGFADITDVNAAEALKGGVLMIDPAGLPPPGPGEFYFFQAIGCEVITIDGRRLGKIEEIFRTGANDVMVVRDDNEHEVLVPVIADVIRSIDLGEARRVTIDPIPGLLD